jgi:hypothetical protein
MVRLYGDSDAQESAGQNDDQGLLFRMLRPFLEGAEQIKQTAAGLLEEDGIGSSKVTSATIDIPAAWDAPVDLTYVAYGLQQRVSLAAIQPRASRTTTVSRLSLRGASVVSRTRRLSARMILAWSSLESRSVRTLPGMSMAVPGCAAS